MKQNKSAFFGVVLMLAGAVFFGGCSAAYSDKATNLRDAWQQGNFALAEEIVAGEVQEADDNNRLIWLLEHASVLRSRQRNAEAQTALDAAAATFEAWDEQADFLISQETAATLSSLAALPYRGRGTDRIMLQTYRALNYLEAGKRDEARVALNAAFQAQSDAVENNRKYIERAQASAAENEVDLVSLESLPSVVEALEKEKNASSELAVYADYVNPFTTWLHGIYFIHAGADGADRERGRKSLERVAQMEPGNAFVREDLAREQAAPAGEALTYVIFEYGIAPTLVDSRIDEFFPFPIGDGNVTVAPFCIALPKLSREASAGIPVMRANDIPAQTLCDMNRVVKTDFENAYPAVLTRTLTTAFLKTAASVAANAAAAEYARHDGSAAAALIALGGMIATNAITYASTEADLRIWQTLPENFSVVRLPTPASRRLQIEVAGRRVQVELLPGKVNVVLVKAVGFALEPKVNQFILK